MDALTRLGFVDAGEWTVDPMATLAIGYTLRKHADDRVVFALVVDGALKYLGKCDDGAPTLAAKLAQFRHRTQATARVAEQLFAALTVGKPIRIYARPVNERFEISGVAVDLVAGLHASLVRQLAPAWNFA